MEENEMSYGQRVREAVMVKDNNITERTIKFPKPLFARFSTWAYHNAGDCYWLAIDKLLSDYEQKVNIENELRLLMDRDDMIATEVHRIEERLNAIEQKPVEKPQVRTFGRKVN